MLNNTQDDHVHLNVFAKSVAATGSFVVFVFFVFLAFLRALLTILAQHLSDAIQVHENKQGHELSAVNTSNSSRNEKNDWSQQ